MPPFLRCVKKARLAANLLLSGFVILLEQGDYNTKGALY